MAVEWRYLENETEIGPITGKQLKALAEAGSIFPRTPVRRSRGSDHSPWTRAGAIKELFPDDVIDQLGKPICDDCGSILGDGGYCPKCTPCSAPPPLPPPVVDTKSSPASTTEKPETKYKNLRNYVTLLRSVGGLQLILAELLACIYFLYAITSATGWNAIVEVFIAALIALGGYIAYVMQMAFVEFLEVIMDIEENTRRSSINSD